MEDSEEPCPVSLNLVASVVKDDLFNHRLCIICQEDSKVPVTSKKVGRASMKRAAEICNHVVTKRIKSVMGDVEDDNNGMFVYHNTNKCYKAYTHSGKLKSIAEKNAALEEPTISDTELEASTSTGLR